MATYDPELECALQKLFSRRELLLGMMSSSLGMTMLGCEQKPIPREYLPFDDNSALPIPEGKAKNVPVIAAVFDSQGFVDYDINGQAKRIPCIPQSTRYGLSFLAKDTGEPFAPYAQEAFDDVVKNPYDGMVCLVSTQMYGILGNAPGVQWFDDATDSFNALKTGITSVGERQKDKPLALSLIMPAMIWVSDPDSYVQTPARIKALNDRVEEMIDGIDADVHVNYAWQERVLQRFNPEDTGIFDLYSKGDVEAQMPVLIHPGQEGSEPYMQDVGQSVEYIIASQA